MASRQFVIGSQYGNDYLYQITVGTWDFTPTEQQAESYMESLRAFISGRLDRLDDRLWWQPETGEIFWEDDGSGKQLPDEYDFSSWWDDVLSDAVEYTEIPE